MPRIGSFDGSRRSASNVRRQARMQIYFLEFVGSIDAAEARRLLADIDRRYRS